MSPSDTLLRDIIAAMRPLSVEDRMSHAWHERQAEPWPKPMVTCPACKGLALDTPCILCKGAGVLEELQR